ncbi:Salicylate hydroxylase [Labilithrix luteola]|uniref:Salicylate hydroxylase n=1 Tax=Labilithrix luteola TaxID=1391654 RepID=A0A0K1Q4E5_9BACT|nr:Salicylate hydroxylase [Labilithrix luteola]
MVVVGAGPTGLMLAIELVLAGAKVVVLERLSAIDETIKAGTIGALAGEALERRGFEPAMKAVESAMLEAMLKHVEQTGAPSKTFMGGLKKVGGHFAGLFLIDPTKQREPERRFRGVQQAALEHILGARASALLMDVRRGVELESFHDDGEGIDIEARGPEGRFHLRCAYLVGCDGGRSRVRKRAGFDFPGTDPTITGHQAIVELDHPEKLLPIGWRRMPAGMMAFGPVPGRIFLTEFDGPPADRDAPVTIEELQRSLRRVSETDVTIRAIMSATRFTDNARQATTYRKGRVLLAGDAAHVHSPFGGQGINLSLLDAVNLGWKLAATLQGRAPEGLLDTYTSERHPVAARALANTRAQVALMRPDPLTSALRDVVTDIMNLDEGNRFFGEMMSGLATRYDVGDAHPLAGKFVANRSLTPERDGQSGPTLYDAMQEGNAVLLDTGDGSLSEVVRPWASRVTAVRAEGDTSMLVRPDGIIAWASADGGRDGLQPALERWFGPHA